MTVIDSTSSASTTTVPQQAGTPTTEADAVAERVFGNVLGTIAKACPSTACMWLMHVGAAVSLISMGDEEASAFYLDELTSGKRFATSRMAWAYDCEKGFISSGVRGSGPP